MTDKEIIRSKVESLMYAYNQKADIGSTGEVFDEKIEDAKYQVCKEILSIIDSMPNNSIWHDANEKLPTGVIVVSNGGNLHIGWSTDEGDGIEDEHGRLITKTYQKWAREKDLT